MVKKSLQEQVVRGSIWDSFSTLISRIGAIIFTVVITRLLLPERYGIYVLATSIIIFACSFLGPIDRTLIRYVSSYSDKNKNKSAKTLQYLLKLKIILTLLVSLIILILAYPLSIYLFKKPLLLTPLFILSAYLFIFSIETFLKSVFFIIKRVDLMGIKELFFQILRLIFVFLIFLIFPKAYYLEGVCISITISSLLVLFFVTYKIKHISRYLFKRQIKTKINKRRINRFLIYLAFGALSAIFFSYIDILMLGVFVSSSYVGFYGAAFALVTGLLALINFHDLFLTVFTKVKKINLSVSINNVLKYIFIFSIPTAFGAAILGHYLIRILYGYDYLFARVPLMILAALIAFEPISMVLSSVLTAKEKPVYLTKMLVIATILNFVLNLIFISTLLKISELWAIGGAGIATLISRAFYALSLIYISNKKMNIKLDFSNLFKPFLSSLIMAVVLIITLNFISDVNLISGAILVITGGISYILSMIIFKGITKEDLLILRFFHKNK